MKHIHIIQSGEVFFLVAQSMGGLFNNATPWDGALVFCEELNWTIATHQTPHSKVITLGFCNRDCNLNSCIGNCMDSNNLGHEVLGIIVVVTPQLQEYFTCVFVV